MKDTDQLLQIASNPTGPDLDTIGCLQLSIFEKPPIRSANVMDLSPKRDIKLGDLDEYRNRMAVFLDGNIGFPLPMVTWQPTAPMRKYAEPVERSLVLEDSGPSVLASPEKAVGFGIGLSSVSNPLNQWSRGGAAIINNRKQLSSYAGGRAPIDLDLLYLVALTMIEKVGPKTSRALLQQFGTAESIFRTNPRQLIKIPFVGEKLAKAIQKNVILRSAERQLEFANKNGIDIVSWYEESYPKKLKSVDDSPLVLYVKGNLPKGDRPHIAVVGTRRPSIPGKKIASEFSAYFAERGIVVVSGLAYGIDYESHAATLAAGGCTMAVLGHGLDQIYPRNHANKAREIVAEGGVLLTEFCTGTQPDAYNFPARNRIISGLSDAVLVVEATEKGGALITAKCAFEQDREVFAIPGALGTPTSVGCNRLIRDNIARIACEPADVLDSLQHLLRLRPADRTNLSAKMATQLSPREHQVCQGMEDGLQDLDTIAAKTGIFGSELQAILLGLEFRQIVGRSKGNKFQLL